MITKELKALEESPEGSQFSQLQEQLPPPGLRKQREVCGMKKLWGGVPGNWAQTRKEVMLTDWGRHLQGTHQVWP